MPVSYVVLCHVSHARLPLTPSVIECATRRSSVRKERHPPPASAGARRPLRGDAGAPCLPLLPGGAGAVQPRLAAVRLPRKHKWAGLPAPFSLHEHSMDPQKSDLGGRPLSIGNLRSQCVLGRLVGLRKIEASHWLWPSVYCRALWPLSALLLQVNGLQV
jgi:hypothetical protein